MAIFTPLINYAGYEHCLNAMPCFVHPGNGAVYGIAIEKRGGVTQNLSVYRMRSNTTTVEHVHTYLGGQDSAAQIAAGGCVVDQAGRLHVWASAVPMGIPPITKTGFVNGWWPPIPHVDEPWSASAGGGGVTLFPHLMTNPAWEGKTVSAGEWVDMPAVFGVPSAPAYLIRFVATCSAVDVRVRAGTDQSPSMLTMNSQVAGIQQHIQGWAPGPRVWISTAQGSAQVWLQVVGFSA